ncbi:hypothetical protein EA58_18210 [Photobacterium galatheae]|uniref:Uncharacterized protein n=2 Tax=Photobacterium galatheae TaxID=1654360 RepID=A0A066RS85_9GAMM|nr:hypothetical protein EA58_18210 [Photobacterium galatheae]
MGIHTLSFEPTETHSLKALLDHLDAEFARIQAMRPDKNDTDLLLGLMTKTHLAALEQLQQTAGKSEAMQTLFVQTLGTNHATRFTNQHQTDCILITRLWMLVLGNQNMAFSYVAEHAASTVALLFPEEKTGLSHSRAEQKRRQFMQAYYHGKDLAQRQSAQNDRTRTTSGFHKAIYCWLRRVFPGKNR